MVFSGIELDAFERGLLWGGIGFFISALLAFSFRKRQPGIVGIPLAISALIAVRSVMSPFEIPLRLGAAGALLALGAYLAERRLVQVATLGAITRAACVPLFKHLEQLRSSCPPA